MSRSALLAVLAAAVLGAAFASEFTSPHVVHLTSSNYEEKTGDGKVYFIKYYAPWCGHCKRLAGTWKELGEAFKDVKNVAIAHVDCTEDRDVCTSAQVRGYPTLKVVYKGEEIEAYRGNRDKDSLKSFLEETVKKLTSEA
ncbi:hypothetical protein Vretimale_1993 [Volvox reticuliferus]|uniref:Uncharacterized protein n=1 Tax=Volvox reticuliferus TaxID=1737510 RepID=A0A8J4C2K1_9CHLO|nr:hypothetical protein Vretifemale_4258 [Volvox reticuliferus]GIL96114.1 hypothetical protein Vretimale_1993 [Volvox reticuliferus]